MREALDTGLDGVRVVGDAVCDESTNWGALLDYEASLKDRLGNLPILGLCTYRIAGMRPGNVAQVSALHDQVISSNELPA
ncbi:MEDS domain-containing protein, partial [Burkholderia sp. SIMBA_057]